MKNIDRFLPAGVPVMCHHRRTYCANPCRMFTTFSLSFLSISCPCRFPSRQSSVMCQRQTRCLYLKYPIQKFALWPIWWRPSSHWIRLSSHPWRILWCDNELPLLNCSAKWVFYDVCSITLNIFAWDSISCCLISTLCVLDSTCEYWSLRWNVAGQYGAMWWVDWLNFTPLIW